ncbi:putative nuclease HARBI1 [Episyrphus balteatus]|uniref:putative nuclease HARBI1 n=1 Tax=Episyrphus balteatus TaxID=286459 RepID=UPI0024851BC7|nr:putative nuclease HARBI1 [Episyrphus balteatus]
MPTTQNEILSVQQDFFQLAKFPRVVSAIDCTHVRIISPGGDTAENFRNRKGYFSINVQVLCACNLKIQDIVTRWPGSTHDSLIFSNSAIKYQFDNGRFRNGILLGDGGYFSNDYLMTPLNDPQTRAERLYNESQIRSRNVVERCFGVWKRRFPVLSIGMRCSLPLVQDVIVATAVLHNMAIDKNEDEPPEDPEVYMQPDEVISEEQLNFSITRSGTRERDIILEYFESLS